MNGITVYLPKADTTSQALGTSTKYKYESHA